MPGLTVGSTVIPYRVRRSGRARRLRVVVTAAGVEVVAPLRASRAEVLAMVEDHRAWIAAKTGALARTLAAHPGSPRLVDGARVPLRGRTVELRVVPGERTRVEPVDGAALRVALPASPLGAGEAAIERALTVWLREQARRDAEALAARHGPAHGLVPAAVRIRNQRRLWGSCTARGVINLNWRLVLAPPPVFEYVVVHELCHLREPHHRPPFWRLVGTVLPDYEGHRRWLRANGALLSLRPGDG